MFDYLIVGQGIAGTAIAQLLLKSGKKIFVVDEPTANISSTVAAGIFNPVTGQRKVKSWNADKLLSFLENFYVDLEKDLKLQFFNKIGVYMLFNSIEEQNHWSGKIADNNYKDFLSVNLDNQLFYPDIKDQFGGLISKNAGFIAIRPMLDGFRKMLVSRNLIQLCNFDWSTVTNEQGVFGWNQMQFKKIIFCDGTSGAKNPLFHWLPYKPVKGELLKIRTDAQIDKIIMKGVFLSPSGDGEYLTGATYNWSDLTLETSDLGKKEIEDKLKELLNTPYEILAHWVGVRPASKDRRPFVGEHPQTKGVYTLNGLGTKGVSLAPYYAYELINFIENGDNLDKEVNINRYYSLYN